MRKIGMWMYQNGGGDVIQKKIVQQLQEREIEAVPGLDLRFAYVTNEGIICRDTNVSGLNLFFSYNAGEQTTGQLYMYETLSNLMPTVNNFNAFSLTEDKLRTNMTLLAAGVRTSDFFLCHQECTDLLRDKLHEWGQLIYKPLDGWGGNGMALIEDERALDTLIPAVHQSDSCHFYVERFIPNDFTDYRIDIVGGEYVGCYGRKAKPCDWRTNISSGGSVILREPDDEVIALARKAAAAVGLEIAGVDIIYDRQREEYVVLEVNGIPAFATPDQEAFGLDFNERKIEKVVELIDKATVNAKIK